MSRGLVVALGAWLVAGAFLVAEPGSAARLNDLGCGLALGSIALLAAPGTAPGFANVLVGSWLLVAPAAFTYPTAGHVLNDLGVGFLATAATLTPELGMKLVRRAKLARLAARVSRAAAARG